MSDLPNIRNGWNTEEMAYSDEPISHFQRKVNKIIVTANIALLILT